MALSRRFRPLALTLLCACAAPAATGDQARYDELHALVNDLYDLVSGPAGERDWESIERLFVPGATMQSLNPSEGAPIPSARTQAFDTWLVGAKSYFASEALYEHQVEMRAVIAGRLGQVFSSFESRHHPDSLPFQTGWYSILLTDTTEGWRIVSWLTVESPAES